MNSAEDLIIEENDIEKRRLQSIIKHGKDIISLIDAHGNVIYRSPSYDTFLGPGAKEVSKQLVFEHLHPDDIPVIKNLFNKLAQSPGSTIEAQWRQKHVDGRYLWMQGSGTNLLNNPEIKAIVVNFRDVTETIEIQEQLQKNNEELNRIFNSIEEVAFSANMNPYELTYMSDACRRLYGRPASDFIENQYLWVEVIHDEDKHIVERIEKKLKHGQTVNEQYRMYHADGSMKWVATSVTPTFNEQGELIRFDGLNKDITDKKNAEQALLDSEKKFRTLIENNKEVISLTNAKREIQYISPAIKNILGYDPEELIGVDSFTFMHSDETGVSLNTRDNLGPELSHDFQIRARHKDGDWRWLEVRLTNKLDDPAIRAYVTNMRDVTHKKKAEELLLNSEKRFRTLIENSKDGICLSDAEARFVYLSPAIKDILGYDPEELIGQYAYNVIHADFQESNLKNVFSEDGAIKPNADITIKVRHKDGTWRWIEASVAMRLDDPAVQAVVTNFRDVTQKRIIEEALLNSEQRFRKLIEKTKDGIGLTNSNSEFVYLSPSAMDILGYDPEELIGTSAFEHYHPDDRQTMIDIARSIRKEAKASASAYVRIRHKDGNWRWIELTATNQLDDPAINAVVTNFRDVTERKNAEEAVINSEKKFRTLIENNREVISLSTIDQKIIYTSPSIKNVLGYEPEEIAGIKSSTLMHPDEVHENKAGRDQLMPGTAGTKVLRLRHKDGTWRWVEMTTSNQLDNPAVNAMVTNFRDVTERKEAEEALIRSEQRFKTLIEKNQDVIILSSSEGLIIYMSPSIKELLDFEPEEMLGKSALDFMHPEEIPNNIGHLKWVHENPGKSIFKIMRMKHKDGSWRWVEATSTSQLHNPAVQAIVSNLRDITARKKAQDDLELLNQSLEKKVEERTMQLAESNKALESFSSLAAHDLQAPLRVLSGYSHMIIHDYGDKLGPEGTALLDVIRKQTVHMSHLVSDLLTFSRVSHTIMKEEQVNLDEMVSEISDEQCLLFSNTKTAEIKISELGYGSCDAHLMKQVWTNLISNALKYSCKREDPRIEIGRIKGEAENIYYVKDNGAGFDARHQHKLFQVFQRLHSSSDFEGTGIGLALVKNVVSRHGGRVWAESEVGKGATFFFSIPN